MRALPPAEFHTRIGNDDRVARWDRMEDGTLRNGMGECMIKVNWENWIHPLFGMGSCNEWSAKLFFLEHGMDRNVISTTAKVTVELVVGTDRLSLAFDIVEVEVYDGSGHNVALSSAGAVATQSSDWSPSDGASNAIDGDTWSSAMSWPWHDGGWWMVTLPRPVKVTRVKVVAGSAYSLLNSNVYVKNEYDECLGVYHIGDVADGDVFDIPASSFSWCTVKDDVIPAIPAAEDKQTETILARTVWVSLVGTNFLSLNEVLVYDEYGEDVALWPTGATATQSSDYSASMLAGVGNDGWWTAPTCTQSEQGAWWKVDLGKEVNVASVKIVNRKDCCGERLSNANVITANNGGYNTGIYHIANAFTGQIIDIPASSFKPWGS